MLLPITAVLILSTSCEREDRSPATTPATQVTIGYSAPEWGGAQYQIMQGVRSRAEAKGWRCIVVNANFDADVQARQIEYLIASGVRAIVAVPLDSSMIEASIAKAHEKGVLFYTVDRAPSRGVVELTVQADNPMAGRQAGEFAADYLTRKYGRLEGTILQLRGDLAQTVTTEREAGFRSVFEGRDAVTIIDRDTEWQPNRFAEAAREVLQERSVDVIYLHSDMIGVPEVLPVLERMGRLHKRDEPGHICIVGVDGGPPALEGIREGVIDAVASQPLTKYGIITAWIERALAGEKVVSGPCVLPEENVEDAVVAGPSGPFLQLPTVLVTPKNVDQKELWGNQVAIERTRRR